MSHLIIIMKERNEKTLPNTCSTIPKCHSHIDENQELWCLENFNQELISSHKLELDQFKSWINWQVYHSMRLNLNVDVTPVPNFVIQFSSLNLC